MNDRLKFRAWDKDKKEFIKDGFLFSAMNKKGIMGLDGVRTAYNYHYKDIILMQSTGLKDKNGKLIYGGDIVKFKSYSYIQAISKEKMKWRKAIIFYDEENLVWKLGDTIEDKNALDNLCKSDDDNNFEIIGNIYENPELLTKDSK